MNNLRIFANPNIYILKIKIDNYEDNIEFKFENIEITIKQCGENQITLYNSNNIIYCENPKCKDDCPVDVSAICKPFSQTFNNIESNICECLRGWEGINCNNRIFIDFR